MSRETNHVDELALHKSQRNMLGCLAAFTLAVAAIIPATFNQVAAADKRHLDAVLTGATSTEVKQAAIVRYERDKEIPTHERGLEIGYLALAGLVAGLSYRDHNKVKKVQSEGPAPLA